MKSFNMEEEIRKLVRKHRELLLLEREENLDNFFKDLSPGNLRNLERNGQASTKLMISNVANKGTGRFLLEFTRADDAPIESNFSSGDIVLCLRLSQKKDAPLRGVITTISESSVSVTAHESFDDLQEDEHFAIIKTDSDVTYKCQTRALSFLEKKDLYTEACWSVIRMLFEKDESLVNELLTAEDPIAKDDSNDSNSSEDIEFFNSQLAEDQKSAVSFALKRRHFAIIQGPPGTGKTTTLIELIMQLHKLKKKVLMCAPTNVAVDNMATRLGETHAKPVRLGHPSRIAKAAQQFAIDSYVQRDDGYQILRDIERSMKNLMKTANDSGKGNAHYKEMRELKKEQNKRLAKLKSEILKRYSIILCTLNSATRGEQHLRQIPEGYFDVVIVDEASQAMEASMWIAIPNAAKLVMAGDINQLPPVVTCQEARNQGLGLSLMERSIKKLGNKCYERLTRQYRMHEKIMSWPNKSFYENSLRADESVEKHLLKDLATVGESAITIEAVIFIDTCGCECEEFWIGNEAAGSKGNPGEAVIVEKVVAHLIKAGVSQKDVGIITPYALQVNFIKKSLSAKSIDAEVSTVDGFQGREKEVIVLSLVRSNQEKELGFVTDKRRLNVAVTRARRSLIVIADSETMEKNELISGLLKHIEENGTVQTAEEYLSGAYDAKEEIEKSQKTHVKSRGVKPVKAEKKKSNNTKQDPKEKSVKLTGNGSELTSCQNAKKYNVFESIAIKEANEKEDTNLEEVCETRGKVKGRKTDETGKEKVVENAPGDDDFNKIVTEFAKSNNLCSFKNCKISTQLVRITCQFCKRWFCLQHGMQEIHGCGAAVRQKERKEFKQKKPAVATQKEKNKLSRKLKQLEEARKSKKKSTQ